MKRTKVSVFLGFLLLANCAFAQTQDKHMFDVGISIGGPDRMIGATGMAQTRFSLIADVRFTPIKWVSIGLAGGMHDRPNGKFDYNLMFMISGNWLTKEKFRLYSGVGYGVLAGYVKGDGKPSHGFQITPVGVSYGKRFFGFAELGTGWMFFPARAGVGFRF